MSINYLEEIRKHNKRLTAKFMTLIENNNPEAINLLKSMYLEKLSKKSHLIGITGYPGAGKSTLISELTKYYRSQHKIVGIIAIDPTSPFTGGALLGDRLRMDQFSLDQEVFIRSMASRGRLGGLAPATSAFIKILEFYGCDIILVETVGTGQSETDIISMVDSVILVTIPSSGDQVQALKAGIFEIADIFVVNKSDLEGKDKQVMFIKQVLELDNNKNENHWISPIIETKAIESHSSQNGILNLALALEKHNQYLLSSKAIDFKRKNKIKTDLLTILQYFIAQLLLKFIQGSIISEAIEKIHKNELDPYSFVQEFLESYGEDRRPKTGK